MSIKGGGLSLKGVGPFGRTQHSALLIEHIRSSEPRYWHSPQSTPPLAEDLGASLPLLSRLYPILQAPPVQDSTVLLHTSLLDVRPHGRNQNKPVRYCVASCINHLRRRTRSIITSWVRTTGSGHRQFVQNLKIQASKHGQIINLQLSYILPKFAPFQISNRCDH